jgi:septum formation protein
MILLASRSPQRTFLLNREGYAHVVVSTVDDDGVADDLPPQALAVERARHKAKGADWQAQAEAIAAGTAVILAADTAVSLNGQHIGTPRDREEAKRMLASLAGTRHSVYTAHCCRLPAGPDRELAEAIAVTVAQVTMLPMSMEDIEAYVASGESDGRTGAYAIQENGDRFVADISGDRDTVIGLHPPTVASLYRQVIGNEIPTA